MFHNVDNGIKIIKRIDFLWMFKYVINEKNKSEALKLL